MQRYLQASGQQVRSISLIILIVGNFIFSAVFVLSTGLHVVKTVKQAGQSVQTEQVGVKEQKQITLVQIN